MKRYLPVTVLLVTFICRVPISFIQNSDFKKLNSPVPKSFKIQSCNLTSHNLNHKTMEYVFRDQIFDKENGANAIG